MIRNTNKKFADVKVTEINKKQFTGTLFNILNAGKSGDWDGINGSLFAKLVSACRNNKKT